MSNHNYLLLSVTYNCVASYLAFYIASHNIEISIYCKHVIIFILVYIYVVPVSAVSTDNNITTNNTNDDINNDGNTRNDNDNEIISNSTTTDDTTVNPTNDQNNGDQDRNNNRRRYVYMS